MSTTDVPELDIERPTPPGEAIRFLYGRAGIIAARIIAGVLALPFCVTLVTGAGSVLPFVFLLLAAAGAWLAVRTQRRAAARPECVIVDPEGLRVLPVRRHVLPWAEITVVRQHRLRGVISLGTRSDPEAVMLDAALEDVAGFLDVVTLHIDAARRTEGATVQHGQRQRLFQRPAYEEMAELAMAATGIIAGLLARPALFIITALALPRLLWHWLTAPYSVVVDDTAVWIVRPLTRDVIPLRAIREVRFGIAGRLVGPAVMIDHRERGPIVIDGFNDAALPLFDAVLAAIQREREARRTGSASRRSGSALRAGSRQSAILTAAAVLLGFTGIAWVTVLTGVPLRTATEYGNATVVHAALLLGAPLESADGDGLTALHRAAARNDVDIARALLARGANVHARSSPNRFTPLHKAAERGHGPMVELLIAAGADVNARSTPGRTPLAQSALGRGRGDTDVARLLLDAGSDPNAADGAGRTALHHAARNDHTALLRALVDAGANIEAGDTLGHRPIHVAFMMKQHGTLVGLLDLGADINGRGWGGRTVLSYAATDTAAEPAIINLLLDAGARPGLAGDDGWNAIQRAAQENRIEMLELFARRRVRLDETSGRVPPALWVAVENGHADAARVLLRGGANPRLEWRGWSPLRLARRQGNATLIALMQMR